MERTDKILFELIAASLWQKEIDLSLFEGIDSSQWVTLLSKAKIQGVKALIFDVVKTMPKEYMPSREVWLPWLVNTDRVEKRYQHHINTYNELIPKFSAGGVKILLLKGLALSMYYPSPNHREGGDIDIWTFDKYKESIDIVVSSGGEFDYEDFKHANCYFKGIPIEIHSNILNSEIYSVDRILNNRLLELMDREGLEEFSLNSESISYTLSPTANAIYLSRHMMGHFTYGLALRHLCDWALFLSVNHKRIDVDYLAEAYKEVGLWEMLGSMTALCKEYLSMPDEFDIINTPPNTKLEQRIMDMIMFPHLRTNLKGNMFVRSFTRLKQFYILCRNGSVVYNTCSLSMFFALLRIRIKRFTTSSKH